jgi:hypothetical protein
MPTLPYIAVARRDHDFRIVETSRGFPFSAAVQEEARWLALDWWGNCFVKDFREAVGHFCSQADKNLYYLLLVQRGPVAPDRFVVCISLEGYEKYGFNPFHSIREGAFAFTEEFYKVRNEMSFQIQWRDRTKIPMKTELSEEWLMLVKAANFHLTSGRNIVVPCRHDEHIMFQELASLCWKLPPSTLQQINLCTFTNASWDRLHYFGTILTGCYSATDDRTLKSVLHEIRNSSLNSTRG